MIKFIKENLLNTNNGTTIVESQRMNEKWFRKRGFYEEYLRLNDILDGDMKNRENIFLYIMSFKEGREIFGNANNFGTCRICDNDVKFISIAKGYKKTCSKKCEMKLGKMTIEELYTDLPGTIDRDDVSILGVKEFIKENLLNSFGRFEPQRLKDRHFLLKGKLDEYLMYKNFLMDKDSLDLLLIEMKIKILDKTYEDDYINEFYKPGGLYDTEISNKLKKNEDGFNHYELVQIKRKTKDENGLDDYDRLHLKRLEKDEDGLNYYDRQFRKKYNDYTKTKGDFELYSILCRRISEREPIEGLENYEKRGMANKGMYHLDHKFSISEGFRNNIPPYIVGSIENLEMIIGRNNLKKHRYCSITKDELIAEYFGEG